MSEFKSKFKIVDRFQRMRKPHFALAKVCVVVIFLSLVIFVFLLFLGMIMYANKVETKEK